MSYMTAHRHPETLFTLLLLPGTTDRHDKPWLPVAPTDEGCVWESDSDDEEDPPPSLNLVPTNKPSQPSLPIVLKEPTLNGVIRKTDFNVILNTITASVVGAGVYHFPEKLLEMLSWSNPYNDILKVDDFHLLCDKELYWWAQKDSKGMARFLIVMFIAKMLIFISIVITVHSEAKKGNPKRTMYDFMMTLAAINNGLTKLLFNDTFQDLILQIAVGNLKWIDSHPYAALGIERLSEYHRLELHTGLDAANVGFVNEAIQYGEIQYKNAIDHRLEIESEQSAQKFVAMFLPFAFAATGIPAAIPALAGIFPPAAAIETPSLVFAVLKAVLPFVARKCQSGIVGKQWPSQLKPGGSDELTPESTEDDTEDLRCLSDDDLLQAVQFIFGEDVDEAQAKREEVLFGPM